MAKKRRKRPPRLALVELGQVREIDHLVEVLNVALDRIARITEDLLKLEANKKGAAQRAAETRRQRKAAQDQAAQPDQAAAEPTPMNGAQP